MTQAEPLAWGCDTECSGAALFTLRGINSTQGARLPQVYVLSTMASRSMPSVSCGQAKKLPPVPMLESELAARDLVVRARPRVVRVNRTGNHV